MRTDLVERYVSDSIKAECDLFGPFVGILRVKFCTAQSVESRRVGLVVEFMYVVYFHGR